MEKVRKGRKRKNGERERRVKSKKWREKKEGE
jgi:hypothetical protein